MSCYNQQRDRDGDGRLLRNRYRNSWGYRCFPRSTPKWWRKLMMTRPRRRANDRLCVHIKQGHDTDGLVAPLGNHKPHEYYW